MGYLYHIKKCGKAASELEKMAMKCHHCGKAYRSKAGLVYHLRSKHGPVSALVGLQPLRLETHAAFCLLLSWGIPDLQIFAFFLPPDYFVLDGFLLAAAVACL